MKAMILSGVTDLLINSEPLSEGDITTPPTPPAKDQILIRITACGVSHTELEEIEGKNTPPSFFPIIPGHQIVGVVEEIGENVTKLEIGDRVAVSWIFSSCKTCEFCLRGGDENLCAEFKATGKDADGGYAEFMVIGEDFAYPVPNDLSDEEIIPFLFAGAIGYRALRFSNLDCGQKLGLAGFGMTSLLILKLVLAKMPETQVYVFFPETKTNVKPLKMRVHSGQVKLTASHLRNWMQSSIPHLYGLLLFRL